MFRFGSSGLTPNRIPLYDKVHPCSRRKACEHSRNILILVNIGKTSVKVRLKTRAFPSGYSFLRYFFVKRKLPKCVVELAI